MYLHYLTFTLFTQAQLIPKLRKDLVAPRKVIDATGCVSHHSLLSTAVTYCYTTTLPINSADAQSVKTTTNTRTRWLQKVGTR